MGKFSVSVRPYRSAARPEWQWVLNVWHPGGRRERRFFKTREEAEAEGALKESDFVDHGKRGLGLDERLRADALEARETLEPLGVSLREVVADFVRRRGQSSATVVGLVQEFLESRKERGVGARHSTSLRCVLGRFADAFPSERACEVRSDQVDRWLRGVGGSAVTFNSYRTLLHALFAFGERRKICTENPVKHVERLKVRRGKVGILTVDQLRVLLEKSSGDVRATVAIGAFAGLRPEEIARLRWEEVDLGKGRIEVNEAISKTGSHRYVEVLPCLSAWIVPLIGSGFIQGDNFRRRYEEARRKAGFALRGNSELRREVQDKELAAWPHDALRHSFASYHLAKFEQLDRLALQLGHESTRVTMRHYRERVGLEEANAYFDLVPKVVGEDEAEGPEGGGLEPEVCGHESG